MYSNVDAMIEPTSDNTDAPPTEALEPEADEPAPSPPSPISRGPVNLSLGLHIGTLLGLCLFAGTYSLGEHELQIAATVFLCGLTMGLVGGIVATLTAYAHHGHVHHTVADGNASAPGYWDSVWDGLAVGLGILLGALVISLTCSMLYTTSLFPRAVYVLAVVLLIGVGAVRAPSWRALPVSIGYALLPAAAGVPVAHFIGYLLYKRMETM